MAHDWHIGQWASVTGESSHYKEYFVGVFERPKKYDRRQDICIRAAETDTSSDLTSQAGFHQKGSIRLAKSKI